MSFFARWTCSLHPSTPCTARDSLEAVRASLRVSAIKVVQELTCSTTNHDALLLALTAACTSNAVAPRQITIALQRATTTAVASTSVCLLNASSLLPLLQPKLESIHSGAFLLDEAATEVNDDKFDEPPTSPISSTSSSTSWSWDFDDTPAVCECPDLQSYQLKLNTVDAWISQQLDLDEDEEADAWDHGVAIVQAEEPAELEFDLSLAELSESSEETGRRLRRQTARLLTAMEAFLATIRPPPPPPPSNYPYPAYHYTRRLSWPADVPYPRFVALSPRKPSEYVRRAQPKYNPRRHAADVPARYLRVHVAVLNERRRLAARRAASRRSRRTAKEGICA